MAEKTLPENLEEFFSIIELSFAAQKNDMFDFVKHDISA